MDKGIRLKIIFILAGLPFNIITRVLLVCKLPSGKKNKKRNKNYQGTIKETEKKSCERLFIIILKCLSL